jgi:hypothetical protein
MMKQPVAALIAVLISLGMLQPGRAATATSFPSLADDTFDPANWSITMAWEFYPGTSSAAFRNYLDGGNPGEFAGVSLHSTAPNAVAVIRQGWTYDPATQGEILSISSWADLRLVRYSGANGFAPYRALILQNGNFFYSNGAMGVTSLAWTPYASANNQITSDQFIGVGNAASFRPDFTANGAPIQFGFMVDHGTMFSPVDFELGVDNWRMTITTVPEPRSATIALVTLAAFVLRGRFRRPVQSESV